MSEKKLTINEALFRQKIMKPLDKINSELNKTGGGNPNIVSSNSSQSNNFMTLEKYISNPTGKGSAYVANRSVIKNGLILKYVKLLRNFRKAFYAIPYIYNNGDILFHVKVPSEHYDYNKISYDVCFLLKYNAQLKRGNREMQLYCNSPNFIFTYCYVYNKDGLIIDKLKSKLPNQALTQAPTVRNPIQSYGYEAASFIAGYYLLTGHCLTDQYVNQYGKIMTDQVENEFFKKIADPELLVSIYNHAEYNHRKTHRKPLTPDEKKKRDEQAKKYAIEAKKAIPKKQSIVHTAPRSKITAKKAVRQLLNDKKKK